MSFQNLPNPLVKAWHTTCCPITPKVENHSSIPGQYQKPWLPLKRYPLLRHVTNIGFQWAKLIFTSNPNETETSLYRAFTPHVTTYYCQQNVQPVTTILQEKWKHHTKHWNSWSTTLCTSQTAPDFVNKPICWQQRARPVGMKHYFKESKVWHTHTPSSPELKTLSGH